MRKSKQLTAIILMGFALLVGWILIQTVEAIHQGYRYAPANISFPQP